MGTLNLEATRIAKWVFAKLTFDVQYCTFGVEKSQLLLLGLTRIAPNPIIDSQKSIIAINDFGKSFFAIRAIRVEIFRRLGLLGLLGLPGGEDGIKKAKVTFESQVLH